MVLNHRCCQVRQDEIELPNAQIVDDFFVIVRPEIALILPITNQQEIMALPDFG
ncbi:hypothetical protein VB735_07275 [Halotia wernerae UHCC 0503]|nr:hypothetical protein [Halotia wernerae UHCC 0503]